MIRSIAVLFTVLCISAANAGSPPGPAPGPLHIIGGGAGGGCIAGAVTLPAEGPGFQTIHRDRSAFWGAPQTIAGIETLGQEAKAAGLGTLAQPFPPAGEPGSLEEGDLLVAAGRGSA